MIRKIIPIMMMMLLLVSSAFALTFNLDTMPVIDDAEEVVFTIKNAEGAILDPLDVVYITGSDGNALTAALTNAGELQQSGKTICVVRDTIGIGQTGECVALGRIDSVDTSAYSEGARIYLHETIDGGLQEDIPTPGYRKVKIGYIVRSNALTGSVLVSIQIVPFMNGLSDVNTTETPDNGTVLYRENDLWVARDLDDDYYTQDYIDALIAGYYLGSYIDNYFYNKSEVYNKSEIDEYYIPYTGADKTVDLGNEEIKTNGTIYLGDDSVSRRNDDFELGPYKKFSIRRDDSPSWYVFDYSGSAMNIYNTGNDGILFRDSGESGPVSLYLYDGALGVDTNYIGSDVELYVDGELSVGNSNAYRDTNPPINGAIIEGKVGIGKYTGISQALDVSGNALVSGYMALGSNSVSGLSSGDLNVSSLYYDALIAKSPSFICSESDLKCFVIDYEREKEYYVNIDENFNIVSFKDKHDTNDNTDLSTKVKNKFARISETLSCTRNGNIYKNDSCYTTIKSYVTKQEATTIETVNITEEKIVSCVILNENLDEEEGECQISEVIGTEEKYVFKNSCGYDNGYYCNIEVEI